MALIGNDAGWTQISREQVPRLGSDVACGLAYTGEGPECFRPTWASVILLAGPLLLSHFLSFRLSQGSHRPGGPGIDALTGQRGSSGQGTP